MADILDLNLGAVCCVRGAWAGELTNLRYTSLGFRRWATARTAFRPRILPGSACCLGHALPSDSLTVQMSKLRCSVFTEVTRLNIPTEHTNVAETNRRANSSIIIALMSVSKHNKQIERGE